MLSPDITYVVSAYNRPKLLPGCLWSLSAQTHENFEVIVTDNATNAKIANRHKQIVAQVNDGDGRFRYVRTAGKIKVSDCYWAAEYALKTARGRWYCFPCDDSYYMPEFGQRMLSEAYRSNLELVICGQMVVGPDASGGSGYRVWNMSIGRTIKTSMMVRADKFTGFAAKPLAPSSAAADYAFGFQMAQEGIRHGIVNEVMVVHN